MNTRIVEIRKDAGLTQDEFSEKMGISKNYVSLIENGKKTPGDRLVTDICREFEINKNWLLTGIGVKKASFDRNQTISEFAADLIKEPESFKARLFEAMAKLDEKDWNDLEKVFDKLTKD